MGGKLYMKKKIIILVVLVILVILISTIIYFSFFNISIKSINKIEDIFKDPDKLKTNIIYHNIYNENEKNFIEVTEKEDINYLYNIILRQKGRRINKDKNLLGGGVYFEFININNKKSAIIRINQNMLSIDGKLYRINENLTPLINSIYTKYKTNGSMV